MTEALPQEIQLNAWTGEEAPRTALGNGAESWGARQQGLPHSQAVLPFGAPPDLRRWSAPDVGYGVLLHEPEDSGMTDAEKAAGTDAPPAVQELLAARPGSVVLRWRPKLGGRFLRRYYPDGAPEEPTIGLTPFGAGTGHLPKYVVIIGGPEVIPWSVQYALSTRHAVGRIPLSGEQLDRYITALLSDWNGTTTALDRALGWTVVHDPEDITALMNTVIAQQLAARLTPPPLTGFRQLVGEEATGVALLQELSEHAPGLVATSSHGRTGPLGDPDAMRARLGLPVDASHADVPLPELLAHMPPGCIWYAQACCSAGAGGDSLYTGLLPEGSRALGTVTAVAALGTMVAPAALELLGRPHPVRAVLGHVEPTFSWTLQVDETGQKLGERIAAALSSHLYDGEPLGLALSEYRADVGELNTQLDELRTRLATGHKEVLPAMTRLRLSALDRQSLVLLGDPTVTFPPLV
ncbi:hypothetical protein ACGFYY_15475 [Streptomyces sp. NPDC048331]|uniref:hypothetical protein n=1 Tax=Streptomyces sp. NPDC048331 TaxID=3365534 RepID=UPI00371CFDAB